MTTKVQTKFGTATLCNDGYYHITSRKEGNNGKKLCRLIFEDFYNITLPTEIQIHHHDGNRTNDNIWNLIPLTAEEHTTLHNNKREYTDEFKLNASKSKTNTGFFRVSKTKFKESVMGYRWQYHAQTNNKSTTFVSASLVDLKEKVIANGFEWKVIDEKLAEQSRQEAREYYELARNKCGIYRVSKHKTKSTNQGFNWRYTYFDGKGNPKYLSSISLDKLKEKVLSKGLEWIVYDEEIKKVDDL